MPSNDLRRITLLSSVPACYSCAALPWEAFFVSNPIYPQIGNVMERTQNIINHWGSNGGFDWAFRLASDFTNNDKSTTSHLHKSFLISWDLHLHILASKIDILDTQIGLHFYWGSLIARSGRHLSGSSRLDKSSPWLAPSRLLIIWGTNDHFAQMRKTPARFRSACRFLAWHLPDAHPWTYFFSSWNDLFRTRGMTFQCIFNMGNW